MYERSARVLVRHPKGKRPHGLRIWTSGRLLMVMNVWVPEKVVCLFTSWATITLSWITLLHGDSCLKKKVPCGSCRWVPIPDLSAASRTDHPPAAHLWWFHYQSVLGGNSWSLYSWIWNTWGMYPNTRISGILVFRPVVSTLIFKTLLVCYLTFTWVTVWTYK